MLGPSGSVHPSAFRLRLERLHTYAPWNGECSKARVARFMLKKIKHNVSDPSPEVSASLCRRAMRKAIPYVDFEMPVDRCCHRAMILSNCTRTVPQIVHPKIRQLPHDRAPNHLLSALFLPARRRLGRFAKGQAPADRPQPFIRPSMAWRRVLHPAPLSSLQLIRNSREMAASAPEASKPALEGVRHHSTALSL